MKHKADESEAILLRNIFIAYEGLDHLKIKPRGDLLVVESDDQEEQTKYPHTRFRKIGSNVWAIEMPHKAKWQKTYMEGSLKEMAVVVIEQFPWMLAPID